MKNWLNIVRFLAPIVLRFLPKGADKLAPFIEIGIEQGAALIDASGDEKRNHAVSIIKAGMDAINAQAGKNLIPTIPDDVLHGVVSTVVDVSKQIHAAHSAAE